MTMKRRKVHPDPVSCQSCRSKKLRCDRVQPCSNCAARGITCNFLVPPQPGSTSTTHNNLEILERIERLESLVLQKSASENNQFPGHPTLTSNPEDAHIPVVDQKRDKDLHLLENIGTREDSLLHSLADDALDFKISDLNEILDAQPYLEVPTPIAGSNQLNKVLLIFPTYRVAALLFNNFESNVDHVCRILHNPSIRSLMKTFYLQISQNERVLPSHAALLLSIFALSVFFYPPSGNSEVAATGRDAIYLSKVWSKGALDVLDYSQRSTSGSLEDIQAYILMSYVAYHLDGFSARGRLLTTVAASIARDLRLHRLDANNELSTDHGADFHSLIDREVKRRVFWHIAATDWLQSTLFGPQEGMYFIHPNHINIRLPKDSNDDEIVLDEGNKSVGESQPTSMTFFLARVRLAHLCRELTDTVPLETNQLLQIPYEQIITLDKRFEDFLSSLPFFFRLDAESRKKSKHIEMVYSKIPITRYCITTAAHTRRCRLHQRFLLRQTSDPRYAYSRRTCLESARAIIQIYEDPQEEDGSQITAIARMGMAAHYTHLALVIMVMDLCYNKDETDEDERKTEVKAALQTLENARHVSPLLSRSLDALGEILQKHKVDLTDMAAPTAGDVVGLTQEAGVDGPNLLSHAEMQPAGLGLDFDTSFDEFWQVAAQNEMDLDTTTWDNLFSALDTRPI